MSEGDDLAVILARHDVRDGRDPSRPFDPARDAIGRGWHPLVSALIEELPALGWDRRLLQLKEKFGTLRFYIAQDAPELRDRIVAAREISARTCEACGAEGSLRVSARGWYATRCRSCWDRDQPPTTD